MANEKRMRPLDEDAARNGLRHGGEGRETSATIYNVVTWFVLSGLTIMIIGGNSWTFWQTHGGVYDRKSNLWPAMASSAPPSGTIADGQPRGQPSLSDPADQTGKTHPADRSKESAMADIERPLFETIARLFHTLLPHHLSPQEAAWLRAVNSAMRQATGVAP
jgi:hypothetical protein